MSSNHKRRIQALEAAVTGNLYELALDQHMAQPEIQAQLSAIALRYAVPIEQLVQEYRDCLKRQMEVGVDQYLEEQSEATGIPLETLRNPAKLLEVVDQYDAVYHAWHEESQRDRITWRGGIRYRGGVPDTAA